jgi:hypothetical protein
MRAQCGLRAERSSAERRRPMDSAASTQPVRQNEPVAPLPRWAEDAR